MYLLTGALTGSDYCWYPFEAINVVSNQTNSAVMKAKKKGRVVKVIVFWVTLMAVALLVHQLTISPSEESCLKKDSPWFPCIY